MRQQDTSSSGSAGFLTYLQKMVFSSLRKAETVGAFEAREIQLLYSQHSQAKTKNNQQKMKQKALYSLSFELFINWRLEWIIVHI